MLFSSLELYAYINNSLFSYMRRIKRGRTSPIPGKSSPFYYNSYASKDLTLADSEHLRATCGTYALSCRFAILHGYSFGILHFLFSAALHAVCFHLVTSLFSLS